MEILYVRLLRRAGDNLHHCTVDRAGTAAAAGDEHSLFQRVEPKRLCSLPARCREHFGTDRVARHIGFILREYGAGILHADGNRRCKPRENAVGHARIYILLLHECRHARKARCEENRSRSIAACPDGNVGSKTAHDTACTRKGA